MAGALRTWMHLVRQHCAHATSDSKQNSCAQKQIRVAHPQILLGFFRFAYKYISFSLDLRQTFLRHFAMLSYTISTTKYTPNTSNIQSHTQTPSISIIASRLLLMWTVIQDWGDKGMRENSNLIIILLTIYLSWCRSLKDFCLLYILYL